MRLWRSNIPGYLWIKSVIVIICSLDFCECAEATAGQGARGLHPRHNYLHHKLVTPKLYYRDQRITSTHTEKGHLQDVTLALATEDAILLVDLKLNRRLFTSTYIEKHYLPDGGQVVKADINHNESHCYYHGNVRGRPDSVAAVSTCRGVRGSVFTAEDVYHIEPRQAGLDHAHYLFKDSDDVTNRNWTCGEAFSPGTSATETFTSHKHQRLKREAKKATLHMPYDSSKKTRLVELYIVNDKAEYDSNNQDIMETIRRTKDIINIVSSLYRPVDMYVALVGIEVWTDEDKIEVVDNPDKTMNNFLEYRRQYITPYHPNDNAQLITGKKLGSGVVGKAPIMTICSWQYSGGVNMDHSHLIGPVATTVAHEMGHNFGLGHDLDTCDCPDERCIMAASGGLRNPTRWSSCSMQQFGDTFHQGMDYCLQNMPEELYGQPNCGNGFLEDGEECDCGLPLDCTTKCCNATTCQLTVNATCATGACCNQDTCQVKEATTVCREEANPCDLSEHCDGNSEFCPYDVFVQDGQTCHDGTSEAYCYQGHCHSRDTQCQLLWGQTGKSSIHSCYEHFNKMGQASGHCGFDWINKEFKQCRAEDVMCGMLHCSHRNEKLMFWKEALAYTMPEAWVVVNGTRHECKGAILDVGLDMPDPGMVPDGAKCGEGRMCISQRCRNISTLDQESCPDCHGRGVCSSLGQCHCNPGYAPPFCDSAGHGGSLHSGPVLWNDGRKSLVAGLCVFFLVILPLIGVLVFFGYQHREKVKKWWAQGASAKYRSIYRAKPRNDIVKSSGSQRLSSSTSKRPRAGHGPISIVTSPSPPPSAPPMAPTTATPTPTPVTPAAAAVRVGVGVAPTRGGGGGGGPVEGEGSRAGRPGNDVKRLSSFKHEDIGRPFLESTTKSLTGLRTIGRASSPERTPTAAAAAAGAVWATGTGPVAHTPQDHRPISPTRPAPAPPGTAAAAPTPIHALYTNGAVGHHHPPGPQPPPSSGLGRSASRSGPTRPPPPAAGYAARQHKQEEPQVLFSAGGVGAATADPPPPYENFTPPRHQPPPPPGSFEDIALNSPEAEREGYGDHQPLYSNDPPPRPPQLAEPSVPPRPAGRTPSNPSRPPALDPTTPPRPAKQPGPAARPAGRDPPRQGGGGSRPAGGGGGGGNLKDKISQFEKPRDPPGATGGGLGRAASDVGGSKPAPPPKGGVNRNNTTAGVKPPPPRAAAGGTRGGRGGARPSASSSSSQGRQGNAPSRGGSGKTRPGLNSGRPSETRPRPAAKPAHPDSSDC